MKPLAGKGLVVLLILNRQLKGGIMVRNYFCAFSLVLMATAALMLVPEIAFSQPAFHIGQCRDTITGRIDDVDSNLWMRNTQNHSIQIRAERDPSGVTFMRIPAANPLEQFWVTWDMRVIQINQFGQWRVAGDCRLNPLFLNSARPTFYTGPITYSNMGISFSNDMPGASTRIPNNLIEPGLEFVAPVIPTQALTERCMASSAGDRGQFLDCVAAETMGEKELASYRCMRESQNREQMSLCLLRENMGQNERAALAEAERCYKQYGNDWRQYPVCMASGQFDEKTARALQCLQQNSQTGNFSYWGMAICYAGPQLGLNAEAVVAMECAMASGGEPLTFVGCTGGRLAMMELDKCLTVGVGDHGCFGKNNVFTTTINNIGAELGRELGPNNDVVRAWNDLTRGPGKNHEAVRIVNNVAREAGKASKNIKREVKKVLPRIKW